MGKEIMEKDFVVTAQWLRDNTNCIFVYGDNTLHRGKMGAAELRDEIEKLKALIV